MDDKLKKTLLWEKRGKGWTMQAWHIMPGDKFSIAAQLDIGAHNGWLGMISRKEAAKLADALRTQLTDQIGEGGSDA